MEKSLSGLYKMSECEKDRIDDIPFSENDRNFAEIIYDLMPYPVFIINADNYEILSANAVGRNLVGGRKPFCYSVLHGNRTKCMCGEKKCPVDEVKRTGNPLYTEFALPEKSKPMAVYDIHCLPLPDDDDKINRVVLIAHDITRHKMHEKAHDITNGILRRERLSLKRTNLMKQALAARYEQDKDLVQKQIQSNIDNIALPALRALESRIDANAQEYIDAIKKVLAEICSPYINRLESEYPGLTRREIETCNLIKHGLSSKDIASTMGISSQTVHIWRKSIRRKLGLTRKRINLQRFLRNI